MKEVLDALTRWGQHEYAVTLHYGVTWHQDQPCLGWSCSVHYSPSGSVSYGLSVRIPHGYHPTDPIAAARDALRLAAEQWPEMVAKIEGLAL